MKAQRFYVMIISLILLGLIAVDCNRTPIIRINTNAPLSDEESKVVGYYDGLYPAELTDASQKNPIPLQPHVKAYLTHKDLIIEDVFDRAQNIERSYLTMNKNYVDFHGNRLILLPNRVFIRWEFHELMQTWQKGWWQINNNNLEFLMVDANRWAPVMFHELRDWPPSATDDLWFRSSYQEQIEPVGERNQMVYDGQSLTLQSMGDGWYINELSLRSANIAKNELPYLGFYQYGSTRVWINEFHEFTYENPDTQDFYRGPWIFENGMFKIQINQWKGQEPEAVTEAFKGYETKEQYYDQRSKKQYHYIRLNELYRVLRFINDQLQQISPKDRAKNSRYHGSRVYPEDILMTLNMVPRENQVWHLVRVSNLADRSNEILAILKKVEPLEPKKP